MYELEQKTILQDTNDTPRVECSMCLKWFDFEFCVLKEEHQEWYLHPHCLGRYIRMG